MGSFVILVYLASAVACMSMTWDFGKALAHRCLACGALRQQKQTLATRSRLTKLTKWALRARGRGKIRGYCHGA